MTIKKLLPMLFEPKKVTLSLCGSFISFNFQNPVEVAVYGDYEVSNICAFGDGIFELDIASIPVICKEAHG